jgi:hypothetical protein
VNVNDAAGRTLAAIVVTGLSSQAGRFTVQNYREVFARASADAARKLFEDGSVRAALVVPSDAERTDPPGAYGRAGAPEGDAARP